MHKTDASSARLSLYLTLGITNDTKVVSKVITGDGSNCVSTLYFTNQRLLIFVPEIGGLGTAVQNPCTASQSDTTALNNLY